MNDRVLSLLGLCRRAGKLTMGNDAVIDDILKGKAYLVIFASDLSDNTKKGILSAAKLRGVKVLTTDADKFQLGNAVGKYCAVISVNDRGFAKRLCELTAEKQDEEIDDNDAEQEE